MQMEMKARVQDFSYIEKYLLNSGAILVEVTKQNDYYLDPPGQKTHKIWDNEMFRVRETNNKCFLARSFADSISKDSKTREKKEVAIIGSIKDILWIFEKTGFTQAYTIKKTRRDYELDGARFSLDDVEGLGKFVEIEKNYEEEKKSVTEKKLNEIFAGMGIKESDRDSRPYMWMLIEKG